MEIVNKWVGVDLDGTLAYYEEWIDEYHIGEPVPAMIDKVKKHLAAGDEVRIFTARIAGNRQGISPEQTTQLIQDWCEKHIGLRLPVTCIKDFGMEVLYDDRCVQIIKNTGKSLYETFGFWNPSNINSSDITEFKDVT